MSAPDVSRLAPGHFRQLRQGVFQPPPPSPQARQPVAPPASARVPGADGLGLPLALPLPVVTVRTSAPAALVDLCRLPVMHRMLDLAQRRLTLLSFESQIEAEYRRGHPYACATEIARAVYGDPRYEQMVNRLKFADSAQCARILAACIARDSLSLAVRTATVEGFGGEFVLAASQLPEEIDDWHQLPEDTVLMDPWAQRQGPARGLLLAAGLETSRLVIQRVFC